MPMFIGYLTVPPPPRPLKCGAITPWYIAWNLSCAAAKGGYVIQHTKVTHRIFDERGLPYVVPDHAFYEEIGYIPKGKYGTAVGAPVRLWDDHWAFPKDYTCKRGTIIATGSATFYDNGETGLPPNFISTGDPDGPWGSAPHSDTPPAWTGGIGPITRTITLSWDCTKDPDAPTTMSIQ